MVCASEGLLLLQMKGHIYYTPTMLDGMSVTYNSAEQKCVDGGGVPASDPTQSITSGIAYDLISMGLADGVTFFTGASAKPTSENLYKCVELAKDATAEYNSIECYYRWRYGFYDAYNYKDEPGTAYWRSLYMVGDQSYLNNYNEYNWNQSKSAGGATYPNGYFGAVSGVQRSSSLLVRMSSPHIPINNDPNPLSLYLVACEIQLYPMNPPTTTRMPQPDFVKGYSELPWSKRKWWVILIICEIAFFLFFLYEVCCTGPPPPMPSSVENYIYPMRFRERVERKDISSCGTSVNNTSVSGGTSRSSITATYSGDTTSELDMSRNSDGSTTSDRESEGFQ